MTRRAINPCGNDFFGKVPVTIQSLSSALTRHARLGLLTFIQASFGE